MNKTLAIIGSLVLLLGIIVMDNKQDVIEQMNQDLTNAPSAAGGTNYYVCDTGDDTNDGLSEATPFQSFGKAMAKFKSMNGGDSVLFCRGGVFTAEFNKLYNMNCSASATCTIADYGDEGKERPQIVAHDITALRFEDGGNADQDGGYAIRNLILHSATQSEVGIFLYNDVDDIVIDNVHIQGFRIGIYPGGSNALNGGSNGKVDRLIFKNSTVVDNVEQGWFGGCVDCLIESNHFENNGFSREILNHNIYIANGNRITFRDNTLYKSAIVNGKCTGVSLVAHGVINDLLIENNLIKEDPGAVSGYCWGISVDPGYDKEEVFTNIVIRNNKLLNVGNVAIGCSSCDGALIEGNTIIDEGSILVAGIQVPVKVEDTVKAKNVTISNNTILLSHMDGKGVAVAGDNVFDVINNTVSQPEEVVVECIKRSNANSNIDISSNNCGKHTDIAFVDSTTNEVVSSTGTITDIEIVNTETADTADTTDTTDTTDTADTTDTTDTTDTADTGTTDLGLGTTNTGTTDTGIADTGTTDTGTTDTGTTDTGTTDTATLEDAVTYDEYKKAKGKGKKSPLDKCRATANDKCLMR